MNNGGIALRLVNCAKVIGGRMPGALAQSNVIANMLFGAISGSGAAALQPSEAPWDRWKRPKAMIRTIPQQ